MEHERDPFTLLADGDLQLLADAVNDVIEAGYETCAGEAYDSPADFDALKVRLEAACVARGL